MSHVGRLIKSARKSKGLRCTELVGLVGYRNTAKGLRRLNDLEDQGKAHPALLKQLVGVLGIDDVELQQAVARDRDDAWAAWQEWVDTPVPMTMKAKWLSGFYASWPLPSEVAGDPLAAEAYARRFAMEHGITVCLVLSRRESVWLDGGGRVVARERAEPGAPVGPRVTIKGRPVPGGTF